MHHALRDALMVEVEDLFAEVEVLEQRRAARAGLERVLIVADRTALRGGQDGNGAAGRLMQFAAFAAAELLVMNFSGGFRRDGCFLRRFRHGLLQGTNEGTV